MIFRSVVSVMVVAAIASAAVITMPSITTNAPKGRSTVVFEDTDPIITTEKSVDKITTEKPANMITRVKPADDITTAKPADEIKTSKSAAPAPAQAPMISCYCDLPQCSVATGGDGTCSTRLGCYSEVQPIIPGFDDEIPTSAVTESNKTANVSSVNPIISELDEFVKAPIVATTEHVAVIRGSFGCLDYLNFAKQSCNEILKSMEAESSEFPTMQVPTNGAAPSAANTGVHAFHCCQTERCNGNQSGPAEGSVKSVQAVLAATLKNTVEYSPGGQNSTVGVPWTPTVESSDKNIGSLNNVESLNNKSSVNNVELSNAKKMNAATSELWQGYFPLLGEPKAPTPLQSDTIFEDTSKIDATTPAVPTAMLPTSAMAIPVIQEITHEETVAHVKHVVTKRHDDKKAVPVLKQIIDDQENIADFDDDIAAEVAAAVATVKSQEMTTQKVTVSSESPISSSDSWAPRHSGVPDFIPTSSLKKKNITINSISATRGINNNSNSHNNQTDNNDSNRDIFFDTKFIIGISLMMMFVLTIVSKCHIFSNYKSMCRNPDQPCACNDGLTRRRPRTQPSSSHPHAAAAAVDRNASTAVNRNASTAPLLPPPNPGHKYRGHANAGASYNDSIGETTYVLTAIPAVPDHWAPVRVVRR